MNEVQEYILKRAMQKVASKGMEKEANGMEKEAGFGSTRALKNARKAAGNIFSNGLDYLSSLLGISRKMDIDDNLIHKLRLDRYNEASQAGADALSSLPTSMKTKISTSTLNNPYSFGIYEPVRNFYTDTDLSNLRDTLNNFEVKSAAFWFDGMNPNYVKRQLQRAKAAQNVMRETARIPNSVFRKKTYDSIDDVEKSIRKTMNYVNK